MPLQRKAALWIFLALAALGGAAYYFFLFPREEAAPELPSPLPPGFVTPEEAGIPPPETLEEVAKLTDTNPLPPPATDINVPPLAEDDHVQGDRAGALSIITYLDQSDLYGAMMHGVMKEVVAKNPGKAHWVYRHYILAGSNSGLRAALASECAREIGGEQAFWGFTDRLAADRVGQGVSAPEYTLETFLPIVRGIGVAEDAFTACFNGKRYHRDIMMEGGRGSAAGAVGAPSLFFLQNASGERRYLFGAQTAGYLQRIIEEML